MNKDMKITIAGYKAHASRILKRLLIESGVKVIGVFTDSDDDFCLLGEKPIGRLAKEHKIPVYKASQLTEKTLRAISGKGGGLDLLLLVEWKELIKKPVYSIPSYGTFNIHDSLLPAYRGSSPINWAIINGLTESGATFYSITDKADDGPIYAQKKINISPDDYALDVLDKMVKAYEDVAASGIKMVADKGEPVIQDESRATYCVKRYPDDGLLDFSRDAVSIYNTVRALSYPFPGAFTYYKGSKVIITKASVVGNKYNYAGCIPGSILKGSDIWVVCGKGIIRIDEIEAFKGRVSARDPKKFFQDVSIRLSSRARDN